MAQPIPNPTDADKATKFYGNGGNVVPDGDYIARLTLLKDCWEGQTSPVLGVLLLKKNGNSETTVAALQWSTLARPRTERTPTAQLRPLFLAQLPSNRYVAKLVAAFTGCTELGACLEAHTEDTPVKVTHYDAVLMKKDGSFYPGSLVLLDLIEQ